MRSKARAVYDFGAIAKGGWRQLMRIAKDGRRLFISMNQAGKVAMFDIAHPAEPRLLKVLDLGANCAYLRPAAVGHQRLFPE
jgi:hypothetical protein